MFGNKLKSLRSEKKLTQQELAKLLNVSPSTIGMYEQGRRDPDTSTLKFLSNYFNVSTDYLLGKTDIKEPADKILEKAQDTVALHRNDGYDDDLPEEARKEIEDFKEYVRHKYGKNK